MTAGLAPARMARGLRAGLLPDVQLIGGAGRYEVDLLIRVLPGRRVTFVGQITVSGRVYDPVFGLRLALCDADTRDLVCETRTDPMGEFDMQGLPSARYALILGNDAQAPCLFVWEGEARVPACEAPV